MQQPEIQRLYLDAQAYAWTPLLRLTGCQIDGWQPDRLAVEVGKKAVKWRTETTMGGLGVATLGLCQRGDEEETAAFDRWGVL